MKCPVCEREGLKSTISGGDYCTTTSMGWRSYWDEDGKYHNHDPNWRSQVLHCSNGHSLFRRWKDRCLNCDYGKDSETMKEEK